jgi:O-antigen ligase
MIFRREIAVIICVFFVIYILKTPFEVFDSDTRIFRRFGSFMVFIMPLSLAFIEFKSRDIHFFKMAILLACLYYSAHKILLFLTLILGYDWYFLIGQDTIPFWREGEIDLINAINLKGVIGSQRYGFILIFGLLIALFESKLFFESKIYIQRFIISIILLFSCILTFSRSTIVTLLLVGLYFVWRSFFINQNFIPGVKQLSSLKIKLIGVLLLLFFFVFLFFLFYIYGDSGILGYYKSRFIQPFMPGSSSYMMNPNSSEGYRFMLMASVIDYVSLHPIIGSSYQGLYLLYDDFNGVGSVHNQYLDVLLRVGIIGVCFWLYLLHRIFRFCKKDSALLFGFMGILIYGVFHETFKLSYGSFIFGMLLSFSYSLINTDKKVNLR